MINDDDGNLKGCPLPTEDLILKKMQEVKAALSHRYTEEEIEQVRITVGILL